MIEFVADQQELILRYSPQMSGGGWIWKELKTYGEATISRVFTLKRTDLLEEPSKEQDIEEFEYHFRFATKEGAYYRVAGRIFGIANDVMLADTGIKLERKLFVAERNVSIFRRLAGVVGADQDIVVGGGADPEIYPLMCSNTFGKSSQTQPNWIGMPMPASQTSSANISKG